jgi:hypothetical protein
MNNFKNRLREAIKSVFSDMDLLSEEEVKAEIGKYLYDDRTSTILYGWDHENAIEYLSVESFGLWKDIPIHEDENILINSEQFPILFPYESVNKDCFHGQEYKKYLISDDYFEFKAAA